MEGPGAIKKKKITFSQVQFLINDKSILESFFKKSITNLSFYY
jgi:hypothetical protein